MFLAITIAGFSVQPMKSSIAVPKLRVKSIPTYIIPPPDKTLQGPVNKVIDLDDLDSERKEGQDSIKISFEKLFDTPFFF